MGNSKVLIITEGARTDYRLMERLLTQYNIIDQHSIFPYKTNIYSLYNTMFKDTDPADYDILSHLKSHENDPSKKELLDQRYSDILLIFDLEPHDSNFSNNKILTMAEYFVESTDMGKLFLNYPMVEAFYHMKSIPDPDYYSYTVSIDELTSGTYKSRVNVENRNRDYSKFAINKEENNIVIQQNLEKAYLINGTRKPYPNLIELLERQLSKLSAERNIYVLCTCIFYVLDYDSRLLN